MKAAFFLSDSGYQASKITDNTLIRVSRQCVVVYNENEFCFQSEVAMSQAGTQITEGQFNQKYLEALEFISEAVEGETILPRIKSMA